MPARATTEETPSSPAQHWPNVVPRSSSFRLARACTSPALTHSFVRVAEWSSSPRPPPRSTKQISSFDGILGIGGKGGLREPAASLAELATSSDAIVVAVDLPSGVDADTGAANDDAIWADVTVTFGLMKPGLLLAPGSIHAGLLELVDIGLGEDAVVPSITCLDASDVAGILPRPGPLDHKYSQGVTGVVAGSDRYPGAAVLAVSGALHAKAGLTRYVGTVSS